jgi:hypothetical protein
MKNAKAFALLGAVAITGAANAAEITVGDPAPGVQAADIISGPGITTWSAGNTYNLLDQIYVEDGADLVIEAGVIIASQDAISTQRGSLAVSPGGQIFVQGTAENPVIMTSYSDVRTWTGASFDDNGTPGDLTDDVLLDPGDWTTGTWRPAAEEWGNLTVMGRGFISEDATPGNTATCDVDNVAAMEGLQPPTGEEFRSLYGGDNDNDDSGTINYLSLRYGGQVVALTNELNGLSMGGVGRATDVEYVEIMNNIDDGIETWGGAVNYKHFSIWNIGDDSFDVDQGWRGKAQFGLIVQGWSIDGPSQGSGIGDNMCETDGAEDSDYQPVTTASLWNMTLIGCLADGDGATAWRDGARVQYNSCIIMDCAEKVVRPDGDDGDGASGYGHNGTLTFAEVWTTDYNAAPAHVNDCAMPGMVYQAQTSGKLAQIVDTVFFRNLSSSAYDEANARGVFDAGNDNVIATFNPGSIDDNMPIVALTRALPAAGEAGGYLDGATSTTGLTMANVRVLDPRAANDAVSAVRTAPNDGFFMPVDYRGAFGPEENWLYGWGASTSFGFLVEPPVINNCPWDFDDSGDVGTSDFFALLQNWGACPAAPAPCPWDFDNSGDVGTSDFFALLQNWGACP